MLLDSNWVAQNSSDFAGIQYEAVIGYFVQDGESTDTNFSGPAPARFGLIDDSPDHWTLFKKKIERLDESADRGTAYKVLFLGRHGQGYHNVGEDTYGTKAWDDYWSLLDGDGKIVWGPDAKLTEVGLDQARAAHRMWKSELQTGGGVPLPGRLYSSPLSRAASTLQITFDGITTERPLIKENLRETMGVHTCDKRSTRTEIHEAFPGFDIEPDFSENDELWKIDVRETDEEQDLRSKAALDEIFKETDVKYISIVAHGGVIQSVLRVIGHNPYFVSTGGIIPLIIKATLTTS